MKNIKGLEIDESWYDIMYTYFNSLSYSKVITYLEEEWKIENIIYPDKYNIFHAYNSCPFDKVKVVILGQDPYINKGQAHGLAFSVQEGIQSPPSLQNIIKELNDDLGTNRINGCLQDWANQGVLLLNSILTVKEHKSLSHANIGWEIFTDYTINLLSLQNKKIVFLLWGKYAQEKQYLINQSTNYILKTSHPSPFSARYGFFGCKHFSKTNRILELNGKEPINWNDI